MIVNSLECDDRRIVSTVSGERPSLSDGKEVLAKSDIVELSARVINNMACDELVRMIRVANLPGLLWPNLDRHLPFYDQKVLTRLAHLAQRCCRNQGQGSRERDTE